MPASNQAMHPIYRLAITYLIIALAKHIPIAANAARRLPRVLFLRVAARARRHFIVVLFSQQGVPAFCRIKEESRKNADSQQERKPGLSTGSGGKKF